MMTTEDIVVELVVNGGDARSKALEAVMAASTGDYETAEERMKQCSESLQKAHMFQTAMIQQEIAEEKSEPVSLIMVHGQDHLMDAMTVRDMAELMIGMYKKINELERRL
jgi:PTS system cellobiose-specific IIA component